MRVKKIKNISEEATQVDLEDGSRLMLQSGASFKNIRVKNLNQIKDRVDVVTDLGEIREDHTSGSKQLYD